MIAHLEGVVFRLLDRQIILQCNGVGYLVTVGSDLISSVKEGEQLALCIHTQVKEDDLSLFGFLEMNQWRFFQQLISVSGIGAKTAMAILDMPVHMVGNAIQSEDLAVLTQVPGLGKKTAARLVLELKGKVDFELEHVESVSAPVKALQEEALEALLSLGYDKPTIIRFLNSNDGSYDSAEALVTAFLQKV